MPLRSSKRRTATYAGRVVYDRKKNFFSPSGTFRILRKVSGIPWRYTEKYDDTALANYCYALINELIYRIGELIRFDSRANQIFFILRKVIFDAWAIVIDLGYDIIPAGLEKIIPKRK